MRKSPRRRAEYWCDEKQVREKAQGHALLDSLVSRDYFLSAMGYLGN